MSTDPPRFGAIGDEHAVDVHRPWILVEGRAEMEQVTRDIIVLIAIDLARLPSVIDIGSPVVAVLLVHRDLEAVRLGFADVLVLLFIIRLIDIYGSDRILGLRVECIYMKIRLAAQLLLHPELPSIRCFWFQHRIRIGFD